MDSGEGVKFSSETLFVPDKYDIVWAALTGGAIYLLLLLARGGGNKLSSENQVRLSYPTTAFGCPLVSSFSLSQNLPSRQPLVSEIAHFWSGLARAMQQCTGIVTTQLLWRILLSRQCNKIVKLQWCHDLLISWVGFTKPNRATTEIFYLLFVNRLHELLLTRMSIMWDFFEPIYEVFIHLVWPQNGNCYPTIIPVNYPLSLCLHSVNIGYKTTSHFLFK